MEQQETELQEIERQLSCPEGQRGIEMAEMMNATNIGMTLEAIKSLEPGAGHSVLELGHGNCGHLELLLQQAADLSYTGIEISVTMQQEALRINKDIPAKHKVLFCLYDGRSIPFPDHSFDRIMTVNTIYFWPRPVELLNEIHRVLKPGGIFALAYAQRDFMEQLPFVQNKFRLFDNKTIRNTVSNSKFTLKEIKESKESVMSKAGLSVTRKFAVAVMTKKTEH